MDDPHRWLSGLGNGCSQHIRSGDRYGSRRRRRAPRRLRCLWAVCCPYRGHPYGARGLGPSCLGSQGWSRPGSFVLLTRVEGMARPSSSTPPSGRSQFGNSLVHRQAGARRARLRVPARGGTASESSPLPAGPRVDRTRKCQIGASRVRFGQRRVDPHLRGEDRRHRRMLGQQ